MTPELREWAIDQFTEEELAEELRKLKEEGGRELSEFIEELEQVVRDHERTQK